MGGGGGSGCQVGKGNYCLDPSPTASACQSPQASASPLPGAVCSHLLWQLCEGRTSALDGFLHTALHPRWPPESLPPWDRQGQSQAPMTGGPEAGARANYVKPGNRHRAKFAGNPEGPGSVLLVGTPYDHLACLGTQSHTSFCCFSFPPFVWCTGFIYF